MTVARTMVHALNDQAARFKDQPALWTRRDGRYQPTSWTQYAARVRQLALGLHGLGFGPGNAMAILSFNREEWLLADLAAMALGGVAVGLYTTSSPDQIEYVVGHCEARIAVVENAQSLALLQALRVRLPKLEWVIVLDAPGQLPERVKTFKEVLEAGRLCDEAPYWERVKALDPAGLATLIYTSGTTGPPKGVMLTHRNICWTADRLTESAELCSDEVLLSYLPLSHIAEQVGSIYGPLHVGMQVYFAESLEKVPEHLKEVRPTVFFGVPRVWEKFKARAEQRIAEQSRLRQALVGWARGVALERHQKFLEHEWISPVLEARYQLALRLVFKKLKARIGFDRTRIFATSAAPIGREVLDFFTSTDMILRELYGQSEVTGPTSVNILGATRMGSVGRPMSGVEVRIAQDGEVLVRGENVCPGYFKDPAATAELLQDGWLHSGDVGELDGQGYLKITGRKKELIVTSGGKKTSPSNIEGLLKSIAPVGNAMVVGERRNFLVALLPLDPERVPDLARAQGWPLDAAALAASPEFKRHLEACIERDVNSKLAKFETIKKFAVLPQDFSVETGELTPTLKVRRKVVEAKYSALIESLYA